MHLVAKVTEGTRYALTIAFTCDTERGVAAERVMERAFAMLSGPGSDGAEGGRGHEGS